MAALFEQNILLTITSISSIVIAVTSLFLSMLVSRSQQRHRELSVRPVLQFGVDTSVERTALTLHNYGLGPAEVSAIRVFLDGEPLGDGIKVLLPAFSRIFGPVNWATVVLARREEAVALLWRDRKDGEDWPALQDEFRRTFENAVIEVEYKDLYGRRMPSHRLRIGDHSPPQGTR